ncbi:hypothetical protein M5W83_11870 [Paenibacillus thiaminolyticus]|uniref:Uncharacterized protein n=1 Tax=Paenibacillus thiaminolyticus TaxID=49283 RepID=A0ABT4FUJ8_PANTH|nr:hypothetical protein [Paenibacillus thiaminolyticus]MCY9537725.1 hypothetical protein [Paenibacillus thiaminolyticus]MCY9600282.1 hypothetical protein [Paenibacillus thiaminolyticus]MCY9607842.1 hypothetical protein [Paenibacillus thiaminolyticus]MCY9613869.1 hypothetical protein [Paenibacillus thiaminolyticus]MCY9617874.1 hypothetical protein [Paenibacillus thiaminolyticus]
MKVGRRLYFDIATGNVIIDTGERSGNVIRAHRSRSRQHIGRRYLNSWSKPKLE